MLDHISIQVDDLAAAAAFYDTVLEPLGGRRFLERDGVIGYGVDRPSFWIGVATTAGRFRESHLAFAAPDRDAVVAFWNAALRHHAEPLHPPRVWPEYHENYFGAFVRDPDGNNVEAVCHLPDRRPG
jgi:catechol 2,3-dioxygenase-like lactoylglutathione lyase family enzyme